MNNPDIFNAALIGCASGIALGRTPSGTNNLDYARMAGVAQAFATALDAAIPVIQGGPTQGQIETITELCKAYYAGKYPSSTNTSSYTQVAQVIKAEWTAITTALSEIGGASVRILAWGVAISIGPAWLSRFGFSNFGVTADDSQLVAEGEWRLHTDFDMNADLGGVAIYVTPYSVAASFPSAPLRANFAVNGRNVRVLTEIDTGSGFNPATLPVMITIVGNRM